MSQIVFLAPHASMFQMVQTLLQDQHADIQLEQGLLSQGITRITSLVDTGTEIVITRGATALALRNSSLPITVVEVPITGFDIIRTIEKAKNHGRRIGVVAFPSMLDNIQFLAKIFDVSLHLYPLSEESQVEATVSTALHDGADVIIGGFITDLATKKLSCPFELIASGVEGILQAIHEARRIAHARNLEKAKTQLLQTVLDYSQDGIISIDSQYVITSFNPIAEKITGIPLDQALNKAIHQICPQLQLQDAIEESKDSIGQLLKISNADVICNKIPIILNNQTTGAVITLQDVTKLQQVEAKVRNRIYSSGHYATFHFTDIEQTSSDLAQTVEIAKQYALTNSSVLLTGETGCGKEVFAQSIHNHSLCCKGPFVAINCAALPSQILESELFGYEPGAFTGANPKGKMGLFEIAHGGTLFLDEIAELDYFLQSKLLRVIQEKKVQRLGSDRVTPVNVRIIAATNMNLKHLIAENKFRADLYYRINVLQLKIPPLRQRQNDIILLAEHFLAEGAKSANKPLKLTAAAKKELLTYSWFGNVRELKNLIERLLAVSKNLLISEADIRLVAEEYNEGASSQSDTLEKQEIQQTLHTCRGRRAEAAKILGVSRSTLWRKMVKYHLT